MNEAQNSAPEASPAAPVKQPQPGPNWPALIPGLLVLGLGLFFLSHTLGWLPGSLWRYLPLWPWLFIIFIGVRKMACGTAHDIVIGLMIALLGGELTMQTLGYAHGFWHEVWEYWPILLIVGGVLMLLEVNSPRPPGGRFCQLPGTAWQDRQAWREQRRAWRSQYRAQKWSQRQAWRAQWQSGWQTHWPPQAPGPGAAPGFVAGAEPAAAPPAAAGASPSAPEGTSAMGEGWLRMESFFSENKRRIVTPGFSGGHVAAIFGSCKLDLRAAPQPPGARLHIQANAVFGEVQIYVPSIWKVTVHGAGVFGNFQDDTLPPVQPMSESDVRLDVYGTAAFGQVSVRS